MDPKAGVDRCGKSRPQRDSIPYRPARSESLHRLSYPGPQLHSEELCNVCYWGVQTGGRIDIDYSSKRDMKNTYDIFGLPHRKKFDFRHIWEDNIKINSKNRSVRMWTAFAWLRIGSVPGLVFTQMELRSSLQKTEKSEW